MSETGVGESATGRSGLLDEVGNPISGGRPEEIVEPLVRFAKEQPLATAVGALVPGYILGKIF